MFVRVRVVKGVKNVTLQNKKIPMDELLEERRGVLQSWKTGPAVENLEDSLAYQKTIPLAKRFGTALRQAVETRSTLTQPRAGVCLVRNHIELLRHLQNEGGADLLPTTIDSYTRQNRYQEAENGIEESMRSGRSLLNGFPAVNYGAQTCREVTEAVDRPIQVRHGTPDARLLCEITLAGGFTAFEGGGISYNIPYAKNVPLETSIAHWQYVDRLVGYYAENGIEINREPFGPLTGTMVPPSISNAVGIIEALLAAEQGVTDITLGYGQCGNLCQDMAAVFSLRELSRSYLDRFGYNSVSISTCFHQWMGGFPADEAQAFGVISWGAVAAAFARATKIITKTPHEAMGIPTAEANVSGLKTTGQVLRMLKNQQPMDRNLIAKEVEMINAEVVAMLEKTLELGEGDFAAGTARAFQAGVLDVPFAPSRAALGAILPVRDMYGAVRFFEFGNLPFNAEIKAFHRAAIEERAKREKRVPSFQMVTDDIYAVSKGRLVGSPR
jgi:methylaspartate mutase epsilon subunit